ncbi:MAG: neutral/alkaline non-lysosomal ceramidase N-terminal domain-containing protein [Victivallaceae bacterium]|nr:neutral/alkaline non-lysosomal ceramidase N-terminal domain-containing protein [Victivallaceae bacterium]
MHGKQNKFFAGYKAADITPPQGEFCSFRLSPNKRSLGIHDPLYVHAFYLTDESNSLIMISVDTVSLPVSIVEKIKTAVTRKTRAPFPRILIAATHTHNGAELMGEEPYLDNSVQVDRVIKACVETASAAVREKFAARIGWGHVEVPGVAKNRFQARINGDAGKVDNRLDFLKVEDRNGNYKGIIWHFAAHPTSCMKAAYMTSSDYYGVTNKLVREKLGGFSAFFNGACGNINPELGKRTFERAEYYGGKLADKLPEAVSAVKTRSHGCLNSSQVEIEIPLSLKRKKLVPADDRDEIMNYFKQIESRNIPFTEQAYDEIWPTYQRLRTSWWKHRLLEEFSNIDSERICLQAHRILDNLILTVPGEIFVELQFDLQKAFKNNRVMIFGYANGYSGYIPDAKSYETDSYETSPGYMHRVGQHAGEIMIEKGRKLLLDLCSQPDYTLYG